MKWYVAVGMGAMAAAAVLLAVMGVNEPQRMENFTRSYDSRRIEEGAAIFEARCIRCHGPQGHGVPGLAPALNTAELFDGSRLQAVGYAGSLEDYLMSTIASGRPVPSAGTSYPERMPTWSEEFGGPLRVDQVENVVAFIMNWEERAMAEGGPATPTGDMMGANFQVPLPEGDADAGRALTEGALGCAACHVLVEVGPLWTGDDSTPPLAARAESRIEQPDYQGSATTAEEYLVESVVQSGAFIVEGYDQVAMPTNFGQRVTLQDMADLLAYMLTFR